MTGNENKLSWKCPKIVYVDIKRTLNGAGSNTDFANGSAANSLAG